MSRNPLKTIHAAREAYLRNAWSDATELFRTTFTEVDATLAKDAA